MTKDKIIALLSSVEREGITDLLKWLVTTDFFEAPASTQYHNSFDGGLADHSLKVYELLRDKIIYYKLDIKPESIIIVSLLHDLCKVGVYHKEMKNRKVKDENGNFKKNNYGKAEWEEYETYTFDDSFPCGHGDKSVIRIQQFMKLTRDEVLMIRWHMGSADDDIRNFTKACEICPAVALIHSADLESSFIVERRENK